MSKVVFNHSDRESNVRLVAFDKGDDQRIDVMQRLSDGTIGLGATLQPSGVAFRWNVAGGPQPDAMSVVGSFNDWDPLADPMQRDRDGTWFGWVAGAKPGDAYRYRMTSGRRSTQFIDPRAQRVCLSSGVAFIPDRRRRWKSPRFQTPPLSQLLIVEVDHRETCCSEDCRDVPSLNKLTEDLKRYASMGANAICLSPQSACQALPFAIDDLDGGPAAFGRLVDRAHQLSLAVFVALKTPDLAFQSRSGSRQHSWTSGDLIHASKQIRDHALMWFDDYRVDGICISVEETLRSIRLDGGNHLGTQTDFFSWLNREVKGKHPQAVTIATDTAGDCYATKSDFEGGEGFSCQTDPMVNLADLHAIKDSINFGFNNDVFQRVMKAFRRIEKANQLAWWMTAPGIPMLFNPSPETSGLIGKLARLRAGGDGTTIGLRGQIVDVYHCDPTSQVIVMRRSESGGPGDDVIVVLNFSDQAMRGYSVGMPDAGLWQVRLSSEDANGNAANDPVVAIDQRRDHQMASATVDVPAGGFLILSKDP